MTVTVSDRAAVWQELEHIVQSPPPIMMREVSSLRTEREELQTVSNLFAALGCAGLAIGGIATGFLAGLDPWAVATIVISACAGIGLHWGLLKSYSREAA